MLKEEMYQLIIKACEMCDVPLENVIISGRPYKRPTRAWYKSVGEHVLEYIKDDPSFEQLPVDYSGYLREYFKRLTNVMKNKHKSVATYREVDMKPFLAFVQQSIGLKPAVTFQLPVVYVAKTYNYFQLWRTPESGKLTKTSTSIVFEGDSKRTLISPAATASLTTMPPFRGQWIKVRDQYSLGYYALSDGLGNLITIDPLITFLDIKMK